jgi:hypothetical protein
MLDINNIDKVVFEIRGHAVMLDLQAAFIYQIDVDALRKVVKENINRFPTDFMFELTKEEILSLEEQEIVKPKVYDKGGMVFSEQGIAMLSVVIPTPKAWAVSLDIMRTYARHTDWLKEEEKAIELKNTIKELDLKYNQAFQFLLQKIERGANSQDERNPIGFKFKKGDNN